MGPYAIPYSQSFFLFIPLSLPAYKQIMYELFIL